MSHLPITRMTLYKHGVGFYERRATLATDKVELSFRVEEMDDILKSLTAIDWGGGRILGIDYATPQSRDERLEGCSIRLSDTRSLQDLLVSLRGRRVTVLLDQGEAVTGTLVGLDDAPTREPLATALVSVLGDGADQVLSVVSLARVQGVRILDERGAGDLRFFLQTSLSQEAFRSVTVRLTPGEHDLSVSYIAPAPTWRVSYRLVAEPADQDTPGSGGAPYSGRALMQAWGIFDNRLEEDLDGIQLSLIAGMPISFVYNLYTPFTPERPRVEEEARVAKAPIAFGAARDMASAAMGAAAPMAAPMAESLRAAAPARMAKAAHRIDIDAMQQAVTAESAGTALGELFQYTIATPVTVSRGQSAMVPIAQATLSYRKDLLYNGRKMATHPVATLRLQNETGLTLERGPVTVIERGEYVGEALIPFTVVGDQLVVPYAVELGVKVAEEVHTSREVRGLQIKGAFLQFEEWEIRGHEYKLSNGTGDPVTVLVEHPRSSQYDLFDTPDPKERTDEHLRFEAAVPPRGETKLTVRERQLQWRREEIQRQSYSGLQRYLQQGLLRQRDLDQLARLLSLWEQIANLEARLVEIGRDREGIFKAQQQIQGNMQALGQTGKEGALRVQYVEQLEQSEASLKGLAQQEAQAKAEIEKLRQEIDAQLKKMG